MATLKDVARLANVDVSTVSRALNNASYVHAETKERILAAVEELSYHPNLIARGLRKGKRNTIGVVIPRLFMTVFAEVVQGIEEEARKRNYTTIICHTEDNPEIEKECLNRLRNGFIDGLIIASTGKNKHILRDMQAEGVICTQVIREPEKTISSVVIDYKKCAYDSANFLINKGCKNIGLINGSMRVTPYKGRYDGYHKALMEAGLKETTAEVVDGENLNSLEYGYGCALGLLKKNPKLDAIMAAVDVQGIGAMRALKEKKKLGNVKVISLTGHAVGKMLETSMTSMELPAKKIGKEAAKMTINAIEQGKADPSKPKRKVFPSTLVEREST